MIVMKERILLSSLGSVPASLCLFVYEDNLNYPNDQKDFLRQVFFAGRERDYGFIW